MVQASDNLIWLDLEMTGLNPDKDVILEIASIITDSQLNILAEGPVFAIHQPASVLENMDPWCIKQHGKSGLTQRCLDSQITLAEAEKQTLDFVKLYTEAGTSPMCGNSIAQDRRFMYIYMPTLEGHFHYRNLDVSSVKELAKRWNPEVLAGVKKSGSHLALDDIRESVAELQHYKNHFFKI
ncbi:oligoribonuclease [Gayadomonas joobiniege]|uniref:oligoribonuclease n=1 Tax=Gayadomonas joobiniege TaxID=1234606 RepID=UPI0003673D87|nr:oligoribonuclease [Gayadomonas joobiniege]